MTAVKRGEFAAQVRLDPFRGLDLKPKLVAFAVALGEHAALLGRAALKLGYAIESAEQSIEALSVKVGMVLLVLGGMHFFNLFIFSRMRRRSVQHNQPPPVAPDAFTAVQQEA